MSFSPFAEASPVRQIEGVRKGVWGWMAKHCLKINDEMTEALLIMLKLGMKGRLSIWMGDR